jgi:hypothetical protein
MKKISMLFGAILIMLNMVFAQDCAPFRVKMTVIPATCYNNGKVAYALVDANGDVITNASGLNFAEVRAYYIEQGDTVKHRTGLGLVNTAGNMIPASGWDTLTIDYGTYTIGVEGICGSGGSYVKVDTHTVLTIPTTYTKPSASSLYVTANTMDGFGNHPTLECKNTGRIQLKIENGRLPYYVTVVRHGTTETLRADTITEPQYSGSDETRYDYKDYYTFDSLPAGDWDFYVVDGCNYGLPRTGQVVEVVDFPLLDHVVVYASSGNMQDSNVVKISAVLDRDYSYYSAFLPLIAQYRFTYDGVPSSDWKPFPLVPSGFSVQLTDTVTSANKYCDIWSKDIKLEYKRSQCGDTIVSRTFHLYKPNEAYFLRDSTDIYDSIDNVQHTCSDLYYCHRRYHEIKYEYSNLANTNSNEDHLYYRHHYTHPLTWIYYDTERNDTIKTQTITNITTPTRLYDTEVEAIYGSFQDYTYSNPLRLPIRRTLVDAHGCEVYTRFDYLTYCYDHGPQVPSWEMYHTPGDHCCTTRGSVGVSEHFHSEVDPDGTTIVLEKSPYENRYNFTAVYSSTSHNWTISRDNFENFATILGGSNGLSMSLSDYCMPSGPYWFKVMTPCDTYYLRQNLGFPDVYSTKIVEEPQFTETQQCTDRYFTYSQGGYARERRNTSVETGLPLPVEQDPLPTYFQIIDGPVGGYDGTQHVVNEPIRVSMPGKFVVKMSPSTSLELCSVPSYYDTIYYGGPTVEFENAYAYLCDSNCTEGTAYVKGTNGTPPYTYTLYDQPDVQGNVIETIVISDTDQPAIFADKAMDSRHEMSCRIEDACGAYFHVNFYPRTMASLQKLWFDDGLTVMTTCEGSTIQVHALEIASILKYEWYNPQNQLIDTVSSPYIFIPRDSEDGWYKVVIRNSGCQDSIVDSVLLHVQPSPWITLSQNDTLCPGEEAHLSFTPESPTSDPITFTIAFENALGVETRDYSTTSGTAVLDDYITFTDAKIYPLSVNDGNCDYTRADEHDTIYIKMKTNIVDVCTLIGSRDTVCYGGDARFTARSTMDRPYTISWYSDYELTHLLKTETLTPSGADFSYYDTLGLTQHAEVFFRVEKDGYCPTVNGIPTNVVEISDGSTTIPCGKVFRLYDDGGANGNYTAGQTYRHTYTTTDGKPVTIHFEELNLSETSHLVIISGDLLHTDSILYNLTAGSPNPGMVTSRGNALTLYFIPGMKSATGWSAIVEHQPGISIADVWKKNEIVLRDEVCQSQTNTYDDPYHVVPNVVSRLSQLNSHLRKAGTYIHTAIIPGSDIHGCDSTVTFILTVNPPVHHDTTVVITNFMLNDNGGYVWPIDGNTYTQTGRYSKRSTLPDGCDSLDILDFIVLQVDTSNNEICRGDTAIIGVSVTTPDISFRDDLIPPTIAIGDVCCDDGSIMKVDSFLASDKVAKGVVFYVDSTGFHGLAVALRKSSDIYIKWGTSNGQWTSRFYGQNQTDITNHPIFDMNGMENTLSIKEHAEALPGGFQENAPAAYFCYYYDHITGTIGTEHKGWYLAAAGEWGLLRQVSSLIDATLGKLQARYTVNIFSSLCGGWTSTEYNSTEAFLLSSQDGLVFLCRDKNYSMLSYGARPIIAF